MHYNYKTAKSKKLAAIIVDIINPIIVQTGAAVYDVEINNSVQLEESTIVYSLMAGRKNGKFKLSVSLHQPDATITLSMNDSELYIATLGDDETLEHSQNIIRNISISLVAGAIDLQDSCSINGG